MKKCIAELLGTFLMVFIGTGSIVFNDIIFNTGQLGIGFAFGLSVAISIYLFGKISGAHINPAVTLAFLYQKKIDFRLALYYLFSQITGAIMASFVLKLISSHNYLGITQPSGSWSQSFLLEMFLTFLLMFVIILISRSKKWSFSSPLVIGAVVGLEAFFAGPICGASMNPARSIGPALISGEISYLWIYLVATTFGALLAVIFFNFISFSSNIDKD
jgi:aquaporin Z